jgi:hypothetical protein
MALLMSASSQTCTFSVDGVVHVARCDPLPDGGEICNGGGGGVDSDGGVVAVSDGGAETDGGLPTAPDAGPNDGGFVATLTLSPLHTAVALDDTATFSATGDPSPPGVTWSIVENVEGQPALGGSISSSGVYTAPNDQPGQYHVRATSTANAAIVGEATVDVVDLVLEADVVTLEPDSARDLGATLVGGGADTDLAIYWTIVDPDTTGSQVTTGGRFVSGPTEGTLTLVATSAALPTLSRTVTVHVSAGPFTITPTSAELLSSDILPLHAQTALGREANVTWTLLSPVTGAPFLDGDGMPLPLGPTPAGSTLSADGVVTATSSLVTDHFVVRAVGNPDTSLSNSIHVHVRPPDDPPDTGTVTYAGVQAGRVYVTATANTASGEVTLGSTSIEGPLPDDTSFVGSYALRGLDFSQTAPTDTVHIAAWLDVLDVCNYVPGADPAGSAEITVSALSGCGVFPSIALTDAAGVITDAETYPTPNTPNVAAEPEGALVFCDADGNTPDVLDHYLARATPVGGGTPVIAATRLGLFDIIGLTGLEPGASYTFACAGARQDVDGELVAYPWSAESDPVEIVGAAGGVTVTGTVDVSAYSAFSGAPAPWLHMLVGGAGTNASGMFIGGARVPVDGLGHPTDAVPFDVRTAAAGPINFALLFDRNGDGEVGPNDYASLTTVSMDGSPTYPAVAPSGGNALSLDSDSIVVHVQTVHTLVDPADSSSDQYLVRISAWGNAALLTNAQLVSGPQWQGVIDMGLTPFGRPFFSTERSLNGTEPNVGDSYDVLSRFETTTAGGVTNGTRTVRQTAEVTGVVQGFAHGLSVTGTVTDVPGGVAHPTLHWLAPSNPPSGSWAYDVRTMGDHGGDHFQLPSSATSVTATHGMTAGNNTFTVHVVDSHMNHSVSAPFAFEITAPE